MEWRDPNTITGSAAEGTKYYARPEIQEAIWAEILKGNHVLFLAPRRVGKSSIVKYMAKNPKKHFKGIYKNIQSDDSIQAFYKRMYSMTLELLSGYAKTKSIFTRITKQHKVESVSMTGQIKLRQGEFDYRNGFFELVEVLNSQEEKIVLFLDEFPDVLNNIKNKDVDEARRLLDDLRELRDNAKFKKVYALVFLGSVGLNHIVRQITDRSDKINDLNKKYLSALGNEEALLFLNHLMQGATMKITTEVQKIILQKIGTLPYYLQLIIEECNTLLKKEKRHDLTSNDVTQALELLIRKNEHFTDWSERISKYYNNKKEFFKEILKECAHHDGLSLHAIYNIAQEMEIVETWKEDLDDILVADGYVNEENNLYVFNSPLLKAWWINRNPKF